MFSEPHHLNVEAQVFRLTEIRAVILRYSQQSTRNKRETLSAKFSSLDERFRNNMLVPQDVPNGQDFPRDEELFHIIEAQSDKVLCENDRILFHEGDPPLGLYIVRSGVAVAMVLSESGKAVARFTAEPGTVLGLPAIVRDQPYSLSLVARQGSDIGFLAKGQFDQLLLDQPAIYVLVLKVLAEEVHTARAALASA